MTSLFVSTEGSTVRRNSSVYLIHKLRRNNMNKVVGSITIIGTVISIVTAVCIFLFESGNNGVLSLLVALVGILISLVLELLQSIRQYDDLIRVVTGLPNTQHIRKALTKIAAGYDEILHQYNNRYYQELVIQAIKDCADLIQIAATGEFPTTEPVEGVMFLDVIKKARPHTVVKAVSIYEHAWWGTDLGKHYLNVNQELIENKGIRIKRIFILRELEGEIAKARDIIRQHHERQVEVKIVIAENLFPNHAHLKSSYLIVKSSENNTSVLKSHMTDADGLLPPTVIVDDAKIRKLIHDFELLEVHAQDVCEVYPDFCPTQQNVTLITSSSTSAVQPS